MAEKAELENDLIALNDKLSSALSECSNKDELVKKHTKMAQDSLKGTFFVEAIFMIWTSRITMRSHNVLLANALV